MALATANYFVHFRSNDPSDRPELKNKVVERFKSHRLVPNTLTFRHTLADILYNLQNLRSSFWCCIPKHTVHN